MQHLSAAHSVAHVSLRIKDTHGLRVHAPEGNAAANAFMVDSAKLAEILLRAYRNEKLTAAENLRLEGFYRGGLSDMARALREGSEAELPLEKWRRIYAVDSRFRVHWDRTRTDFNATFVSFFDELIVKEIQPQSETAHTTSRCVDSAR